jgi:predicted transcriptional regulator
MQAKGLEQEMNTYFTQLSHAEKKSVVEMLKTFLQRGKKKAGGSIDIEEYNKEIDEAMAEVARGEYYTHEEVVKMSEKW